MSLSHLILLGIIAVIVIPPEKLPEVARQVARFLGEMRRMTSGVFEDLKNDIVLKPEDLLKQKQQSNTIHQNTPAANPLAASQDDYLKHIQEPSAPVISSNSTESTEKKPT